MMTIIGSLTPAIATLPVLLLAVCLCVRRVLSAAHWPDDHPPIVTIPAEDLFKRPRQAYEQALRKSGPVIAVPRKGRLEFIVDETLTKEVLTSDKWFSFEEGTAQVLNLHPFYHLFKSFFRDIDDLVQKGIIPRLDRIVEHIFPVFLRNADQLIKNATRPDPLQENPRSESIDLFAHTHRTIAEAMIIVILGESYVNERNLAIVEVVATDIAVLTGMYQNLSFWARTFPGVWRFLTWMRVLFVSITFGFFRIVGPKIWADVRSRKWTKDPNVDMDEPEDSVLSYLAAQYASPDDHKVGIGATLWIMSLLLGIIFASVHQTASVVVWVIFELAMRPDYCTAIREELSNIAPIGSIADCDAVSFEALKKAVLLDSFIREVMRTKGDTLSTCRMTTEDVMMAGYRIPKGHLIIPLATLSHFNEKYYGTDAGVFNGHRWADQGTPAVMCSPSHLAFGLGRWACPGRVLAVAEIKMIAWSILALSSPSLEGNSYRVVDPLNITSVPPEGKLILAPL